MNMRQDSDGSALVPVRRSVPAVADSPEMRDWAEQLVARARSEGVELTGDNGLLTAMVRHVLQTGLNVELAEHLGCERHLKRPRSGGSRGARPGRGLRSLRCEPMEQIGRGQRHPQWRRGTRVMDAPDHRQVNDGAGTSVLPTTLFTTDPLATEVASAQ